MSSFQSRLRKLRFEQISFLFSELRARTDYASSVAAKFSQEEWETLGSLLHLIDFDLYLSYEGGSELVLVDGRAGDPDDPPVYGTFAGLLASELSQRVWVNGCDGVWFPEPCAVVGYSGRIYRTLVSLAPEESTALLLILEAERLMTGSRIRSDSAQGPVLRIPTDDQLHEIFD
jgi:hypothetical protein